MRRLIPYFVFILLFSGCSEKPPLTSIISRKFLSLWSPANRMTPRVANGTKISQKRTCTRNAIRQFISTLPPHDRLLLEDFFRCLIQNDSIGYVLLGGKPMGFYSYLKPKSLLSDFRFHPVYSLDLFFEGFLPEYARFQKGFDVWKKYEHLFCGNNIFFDLVEQNHELHYMKVSVINKRLMLPVLSRIKNSQNEKELFNDLLKESPFKEQFYLKDALLGICLGYGEKNARLFQMRANIFTSLGRLGFTLEKPSAKRQYSLQKQADAIGKSLKGFKDHQSKRFLFHKGVSFVADHFSSETALLFDKYRELHKLLTQTYSSGDFLENTLELILLEDRKL